MRLIRCDKCGAEMKGAKVDTLYLKDRYGFKQYAAELCPKCFQDILCGVKLAEMKYEDSPIEELDISVRSVKVLEQLGIKTIGDLRGLTEDRIRKVRQAGVHTVREIMEQVRSLEIASRKENQEEEE